MNTAVLLFIAVGVLPLLASLFVSLTVRLDRVATILMWIFAVGFVVTVIYTWRTQSGFWAFAVAVFLITIGFTYEGAFKTGMRARVLEASFDRGDEAQRLYAVNFIAKLGDKGIELARKGLADPLPTVRKRATSAAHAIPNSAVRIELLRKAAADDDASVREGAAQLLRYTRGQDNPEWLAEIGRLYARQGQKQFEDMAFAGPQPASLAGGVAGLAVGALLGVNPNVVAIANPGAGARGDKLAIPEICFVCGAENPSANETLVGTFGTPGLRSLLGPGMSTLKLTLEIPLCELCAHETGLKPGVAMQSYDKKNGEWLLGLRFVNDHVAAKVRELNQAALRE